MKQLHFLSLLILTLCFATVANAQTTTPKTDKKVVVIKKTIDENGEYVIEKIVTTEDDEQLHLNDEDTHTVHVVKVLEDENLVHDAHGIWTEKLHTDDDHNVFVVGDGDEKHVNVNVNENDGEKTITIEIDGEEQVIHLSKGEDLSDEQKQLLKDKGVHVMLDGDFSLGGENMVIELIGDVELDMDDDIEWRADRVVIKERLKEMKEKLGNEEFDFDFDFDFNEDFKWSYRSGLNCAALGVYVSNGARVSSLIGSGGAQAAGIQAGDVITSINGESTEQGGLHKELGKYEPGNTVTVGYDRDGTAGSVDVTLTAWTDLPDFANSERHANVKCGEQSLEEEFMFAKPRFERYLDRSRKINCAALGVYVDSEDGNMEISSLIDGGGAEAAGLQEGDIINGIDKSPVNNHRELLEVLSHYEPGDMVTVDFERDGETKTVQTALTKWTDLPAFADSPRHANTKCGDENYQNSFDLFEPTETSRKIIIIKKGQDAVVEEEVPVNQSTVETRSFDNALELADFVTYPNPTDGKFRVEFSAEPMPIIVSIVDVTGKEVFRDNMDQFNGYYSEEINLKNEARGAFILSIEQDGKMFTEQVILH